MHLVQFSIQLVESDMTILVLVEILGEVLSLLVREWLESFCGYIDWNVHCCRYYARE